MKCLFVLVVVSCLGGAIAAHAQPVRGAIMMDRPDGSKQCEPKPNAKTALAAAKKELRRAGVTVLEIRRAQDGQMHMQMCGSPTGSVIRIRIRESDREKASALGFAPAP